MKNKIWTVLNEIVEIKTPWLTLIGENLKDDKGTPIEYWRVEKAHSVIALPIHNDMLVLPKPFYRHGISEMTYDFPGGRVNNNDDMQETILDIVRKEIHVERNLIEEISPIFNEGLNINSSFSNQKLFGYTLNISNLHTFDSNLEIELYPISDTSIDKLLSKINCLQCRTILLEWYFKKFKTT